jgi:hypothetical protein
MDQVIKDDATVSSLRRTKQSDQGCFVLKKIDKYVHCFLAHKPRLIGGFRRTNAVYRGYTLQV